MIVLGRVVGPFGVAGWLRIQAFGDDPLAWRKMPQWWLAPKDSAAAGAAVNHDPAALSWQPYTFSSLRFHGKGLLVKFAEVTNRNAAEAMQGALVGAPRTALPEAASGEYYWADLVGLAVRNREGSALGHVQALMEASAHPVLVVVDAAGTQRLLPFVGAVVRSVDLAGGCLTVDWQMDW